MVRSNKSLFFGLLIALSVFADSAFAYVVYSLPGIPASGSPNYTNNVNVRLFDLGGQFLLNAQGTGAIAINGIGLGSVSTTSSAVYNLSAYFNSNGSYVAGSGTLSASGTLPGIGTLNLITARLDHFNSSADLLGFSTIIDTGLATLFGTNESVYISATGIGAALGFLNHHLVAHTSPIAATAVTTIPVPAAVWMFASGLALFGARRKVA